MVKEKGSGEEVVTETITEMVAKLVEFASGYTDLQYNKEDPEYLRRSPTSQLN